MKDIEQRIAIAEACGWLKCDGENGLSPSGVFTVLPHYTTDLNAMHEAEKVLRNQFTTQEETYWRLLQHVEPHPIYATASQRAEAFLRTLNLYKE